ncbi:DNA polymerase III subunit delta [Geobacter sp. AOG2]|uniref:DNA polymerase III subunit delta n=1 Tax=Geobacter sp. AOG2 TaxID=1566347 RepID=UPI001CC5EF5D|nr:DNA polymerase III subunit delta [Geobacter sp. AOG2]GFE61265.1 DNA polymerase III subunit delta [Geobacter sp. AOG2]
MTAQEFETAIGKGTIPPLCYLYGEETFLVERSVRQLLERAIDPSLKDFNFNVFYGNETKGVEILDAAQTLPMFAERRAVLVKRADALKADVLDSLLPYVRNPAATTCLVFTGAKVDQRKKFFQELKKLGCLVEFKRLYDNKLSGFIQSEAVAHGKAIDPAGAGLLSQLIGNNLQELASQIEKLAVYCAARPRITVEDVRTIASSSKAFTAFELARFAGMRDLQNALKSLGALFRNGEDAPLMIGALTRHFRQLWRIRELLDRKVPQADIGRELNIHTFFLGELVQQAKNFSRGELGKLFEELYRCDVASKTGGGQPATLMQGLVVGICTASLAP